MMPRPLLPVCAALLGATACAEDAPFKFDDLKNSSVPLQQAVEDLPKERVSRPYVYHSLKGLTHPQLFAWVGGKSLSDLAAELSTYLVVPPDLWTAAPDDALRALIEANRTEAVRKDYPLRLAPAAAPFPKSGLLSYAMHASGCYNGVHAVWCLRWEPEHAWLAYTEEFYAGVADHPIFGSHTAYDLRRIDLPPADARHFAQLLAGLRRCSTGRPEHPRSSGIGFDTANGSLAFTPDDDAAGAFHWDDRLWDLQPMHERCDGEWNDAAALNFAARLFTYALPPRLGDAWSRLQLRPDQVALEEAKGRASLDARSQAILHARTAEMLDLALAMKSRLAPEAVKVAVSATGDHLFADLAPKLDAVEEALPAPSEDERTIATLKRQVAQLERKLGKGAEFFGYERRKYPNSGIPGISYDPASEIPPPPRKIPWQFIVIDALRDEYWERYRRWSHHEEALAELRAAFPRARRQLAVRDNIPALREWALEDSTGTIWAYQRLRALDPAAAVAVLETMLQRDRAEPGTSAAIAAELSELAPERAREIAAGLSERERLALPPALRVSVGKEKSSLPTLLRIAADPAQSLHGRVAAIQQLVPASDPKRFPDDAVDQVLLKLLTTEFPNDIVKATLREAAIALARRNAARHWDALVPALDRLVVFGHSELLQALALAVDQDRAKFAPYFQQFIESQFQGTKLAAEDVALLAWATDLREFKPQLEAIATSGPGDYGGSHVLSGAAPPITQRYHAARFVAAVWNEEDPATRAKLIAAFGLQHQWLADADQNPATHRRAELSFAATLATLTPADRTSVSEFVAWLAAETKKSTTPTDPWLEMLRRQITAAGK